MTGRLRSAKGFDSAALPAGHGYCIYTRRKQPLSVLARFESADSGEVGVSVITYGELLVGAAKSADPARTAYAHERFFAVIPLVPLPVEAGKTYGAIRAALAKTGNLIGTNDLWIAAHALASGLILVTNNQREFKRVKDLRVENWAK